MVLPPTPLTDLLHRCRDAEEMYRALRWRRMLAWGSGRKRAEIIAVIEAALAPRVPDREGVICGPSSIDSLAGQLVPYLSAKGLRAHHGDR